MSLALKDFVEIVSMTNEKQKTVFVLLYNLFYE